MSWRSRIGQTVQATVTDQHAALKATLASVALRAADSTHQAPAVTAAAGLTAAAITAAAHFVPEPWDPADYAGFDTDGRTGR